jgi:CheY-like chemotaxis protein
LVVACDLLSEIKGSEQTHHIRVVMLSPGGSAERTRGLDLGADDVLSLPFDSHELLPRLRSQLRDKSVADGFHERLHLAGENRTATQQVVTAVNEERWTLRVGGLTAIAVLVGAALVFFLLYRHNQQQNTRVYAAITRLQTGMLTEQRLMERSRRSLEGGEHGPPPGDQQSTPKTDEHDNPLLSLTGSGQEVHLDAFGTGFLASTTGQILTNHHVAEPWWQNDDLKEMLNQGLEPACPSLEPVSGHHSWARSRGRIQYAPDASEHPACLRRRAS